MWSGISFLHSVLFQPAECHWELIDGLPELLDWLSGADETRPNPGRQHPLRIEQALADWRDAKP
jgi:hypothetical protein